MYWVMISAKIKVGVTFSFNLVTLSLIFSKEGWNTVNVLVDYRSCFPWLRCPFSVAMEIPRCLEITLLSSSGHMEKWWCLMTLKKLDFTGLKHALLKKFAKSYLVCFCEELLKVYACIEHVFSGCYYSIYLWIIIKSFCDNTSRLSCFSCWFIS